VGSSVSGKSNPVAFRSTHLTHVCLMRHELISS
jgi:hypothetical protein